jgi:hypothetical protein
MAKEQPYSGGTPTAGYSKSKAATGPPSASAPRRTAFEEKYNLEPVAQSGQEDMVWLGGNDFKPKSEVKNVYAFLSPKASKQFSSRLDKLFPYGWDVGWVRSQWEEATDLAAQALKMGQKVSPLNAFDTLINNFAAGARTPGGGGGGGGGGGAAAPTKTVNLTDPGTAETLVDQALQAYLGRKASDKEIVQFRKALTKAEMKAPSDVSVEGDTAVRSGGFNPATFAQQYAEGVEGAAEYQAATTFLDSFIGALGPRVDV